MTAPAPESARTNLNDIHTLFIAWPITQGETRTLQELILDSFWTGYENSGAEMPYEDFISMLPAALPNVLVQLLAPVADAPHAGPELDFTLHVLKALTTRLAS